MIFGWALVLLVTTASGGFIWFERVTLVDRFETAEECLEALRQAPNWRELGCVHDNGATSAYDDVGGVVRVP